MMLLTKANLRSLPALKSQDGKGDDAIAHVKFFLGNYTAFWAEFNPETEILWGKVFIAGTSDVPEWGYTSLEELKSVRGQFGLGMERDRSFKPCRIGDCKFAGYNG